MNVRNRTNIKRWRTSRKTSNIEKGNKNPWNDFEQERRINNIKLTICFVSKIRKRDKNERDKEKKKLKNEGKKKKVRKNQTTWKNTFLEWKFEEGNKVSIKVKQKQDLDNHPKENHGGEI